MVRGLEVAGERLAVYNIHVRELENYAVGLGGVLVHNENTVVKENNAEPNGPGPLKRVPVVAQPQANQPPPPPPPPPEQPALPPQPNEAVPPPQGAMPPPEPVAPKTFPTKGMGGRVLSAAEQAEFDAFAQRAQKVGLVENPNRTGSFGKIVDGKFQEVTRIDVAEAGKPGFRGKTHIHIEGQKGHLDPNTPLPGE